MSGILRFKFPRMTFFQWAVHIGAWIPLVLIVYDGLRGNLTANPIQAITFRTGKPALVLLVLSLAATPLNTVFGFKPALKVRRALGLYAFMYVAFHFLIFIGLDYGFDVSLLKEAIFEKKYALVGFAAALILLPLAITSTKAWKARLGKNWKRLHQAVYLAGILAVIHYVWLVKSDIREPLVYGGIVLLLLISRIPAVRKVLTSLRSKISAKLYFISSAVLRITHPGGKIHPKIVKDS
jgi:sulfoxide reductase heme-binding subunit YedZ